MPRTMSQCEEQIITIDEQESDEGTQYIYIIFAPTLDEAKEIFGAVYPINGERCHHEGDCCGHYYRRSASFREIRPGIWRIRQDSRANV